MLLLTLTWSCREIYWLVIWVRRWTNHKSNAFPNLSTWTSRKNTSKSTSLLTNNDYHSLKTRFWRRHQRKEAWRSSSRIHPHQINTTPTCNWLKSIKEPALPNSEYRCRGRSDPLALSLLIKFIQAMIRLLASLKVQSISYRREGRVLQMWSLVSWRTIQRSSRWPRQRKLTTRDRLLLEEPRWLQLEGTILSQARLQSVGCNSLATSHLRWWSPDHMRRGEKLD